MSIDIGKTEVKRMTALLDAEHESAEGAARAALELAWEMYEARSKYVVIAQVRGARADGELFSVGDHRLLYPDEWDIDHAASMIKDEIFAMPGNMPEDDGTIKAIVRDGIKRLLS